MTAITSKKNSSGAAKSSRLGNDTLQNGNRGGISLPDEVPARASGSIDDELHPVSPRRKRSMERPPVFAVPGATRPPVVEHGAQRVQIEGPGVNIKPVDRKLPAGGRPSFQIPIARRSRSSLISQAIHSFEKEVESETRNMMPKMPNTTRIP